MRKESLECLEELVFANDNICIVGSDLGSDTFTKSRAAFPQRVLMEGIAEQHLIGFAAGLAANGFYPVVHTIATFLTRRCYEQIAIDLSQQELPALLLGAGGGMVYAPLGPTHQSVDDFSLMSNIPGMKIFAPADPDEAKYILRKCAEEKYLAYMRLGRGGEENITKSFESVDGFFVRRIGVKGKFTLVCTGTLLHEALEAVKTLSKKGIEGNLLHMPLVNEWASVEKLLRDELSEKIFVIEEHIPTGGLFTQISSVNGKAASVHHRSLPFGYSRNYGSQKDHWKSAGLVTDNLVDWIESLV